MSNLNCVFIIGRLTRNMELKYTSGGTAIGNFSIAVNRGRKQDGNWIEEVNYFNCILWGKRAEALSQYMTKGMEVGIEGELKQNRWKDQDGNSRQKVEIVAKNINLLRRPKEGSNQQAVPHETTNNQDGFKDDIPF